MYGYQGVIGNIIHIVQLYKNLTKVNGQGSVTKEILYEYTRDYVSLTCWGLDKMGNSLKTTCLMYFCGWNLIDNMPALVQTMACYETGDKPLSEPIMD